MDILRDNRRFGLPVTGQGELLRKFARQIADPANIQRLARLARRRENGGRPRKRADVHTIRRIRAAAKSDVSKLNDVLAVLWSDQGTEAILVDERRVVALHEFRAVSRA